MNTLESDLILDLEKIRTDFPILNREIRPNVRLVYLDSTATTQKPEVVIQAMDQYYRYTNANIHRGVHTLAEEATEQYELARRKIGKFIGVSNPKEIVFTRNTTESINLVAQTWGRTYLQHDDLVVLTEMEHHSNLVPWQILANEKNLRLEFIPVTDDGYLDLDVYARLLEQHPKLVSFTHMSNVLGTINPAAQMIQQAHQVNAFVLLDGAQSVPHLPVDVKTLQPDFMAFSAHKMVGPTGIGVLYAREALLDRMPPFLGGGDMIKKVTLRSFTSNELPHKFEAGTPAIAEAIGFGAAVDYLTDLGMEAIHAHERQVTEYALKQFQEIPGIHVIGPGAEDKGGVVSFEMDGVHPHDIAQILDSYGIAVRAGHHCAMPLHDRYQLTATTRASFYLYNTKEEVDKLIIALGKVKEIFD